jgi:hypothetical protein
MVLQRVISFAAVDSAYCDYYYNYNQVTGDDECFHSFVAFLLLHIDQVISNEASAVVETGNSCYSALGVLVQEVQVGRIQNGVNKGDYTLEGQNMEMMRTVERTDEPDLHGMNLQRPKNAYYNEDCKLLNCDELEDFVDSVMMK